MTGQKLCLDPIHKAAPTYLKEGDVLRCTICHGERLEFHGDDPGLDDLMNPPGEPTKRYIVWLDYGTEGWQPEECDTLEACYRHALAMSTPRFMITSTEIKVAFTEAQETPSV